MKKTPKTKKILAPHFVCTGGCKLISENPGKCITQGCYRYRNPLTLCNCQDNKHGNLLTLNVPKD